MLVVPSLSCVAVVLLLTQCTQVAVTVSPLVRRDARQVDDVVDDGDRYELLEKEHEEKEEEECPLCFVRYSNTTKQYYLTHNRTDNVNNASILISQDNSVNINTLSTGSPRATKPATKPSADVNGPLRVGNTIYNAWSAKLPVPAKDTKDSRCKPGCSGSSCYGTYKNGFYVGCGYANGDLHIKTSLQCGLSTSVHEMYNFELKGHLFRAKKPFFCQAVGYLNGGTLRYESAACSTDGLYGFDGQKMTLAQYCDKAEKVLVLRLGDPGNAGNQWHASDITMNFIGGDGSYIERAADHFAVTDAIHDAASEATSWQK